jgi:arabinose-5-phosphate isomerase
MADAVVEMTAKGFGCVGITAADGKLAGIITDGDLRRFVQQGGDFAKATAGELASRHPKTIGPDDLAAKAVERMERFSITTLVVTEAERKILGVIHLHDLLKSGIV